VRWNSYRRRLRSSRTVKVDGMNVQITLAELALSRKCKLDRNCTTTLVVVDIDALGRTESHLVTGGAVCQVIINKDIGVARGGKMEVADGKRSVDGVDLDRVAIVSRELSCNTLALLKVRLNALTKSVWTYSGSHAVILGREPNEVEAFESPVITIR